jgi:four helix bundle protein
MLTENSKVKSQSYNSKGKSELKARCLDFSVNVIKFIDAIPEKRINWILANQLLRSATSIGANIIEAKSSSSRKDFIKFYDIALKSANETEYWLGLLRDALDIDGKNLQYLIKETEEISRMLAASLLTMKNKR